MSAACEKLDRFSIQLEANSYNLQKLRHCFAFLFPPLVALISNVSVFKDAVSDLGKANCET